MPSIDPMPRAAGHATRALSIAMLAISAFVIVTTEFLIVGLLPMLARDLKLSIAAAGQLVTLFAFTVMLFGPFLTAALSHVERKRLFVAIMLVFAAANLLAALAPNPWILAIARFVPALLLPVFWGTASETASQLAAPGQAGRAVSQVYLGIAAATLFGIPLGTVAANAVGWRGAFAGLALLALGMAASLAAFMPACTQPARMRIAAQLGIVRDRHVVAHIALSVVVFTAMFTAYTYLADLLERVARVPPAQVGWWLMGFGAVGLIGNWLGGRYVDRDPARATAAFALLLALGMAAYVPLAAASGWLHAALAVWGIAYTALYPVCQVRVMRAASHAQALAGTLNVSAANAGIGLGAIVGGYTIGHGALAHLGYAAAAIALLAGLMALCIGRRPGVRSDGGFRAPGAARQ